MSVQATTDALCVPINSQDKRYNSTATVRKDTMKRETFNAKVILRKTPKKIYISNEEFFNYMIFLVDLCYLIYI